MKRIVLVAGARPNFMKVAPVLRAIKLRANGFAPALVHTGQHYDEDMSAVFFDQLDMPRPDVHLGAGSGAHGAQTARIIASFEEFLLSSQPRPAGVVVVGDVNSTMACALAAVKLGIPVAHVEAGLRSFDRSMPEEINRVVTDAVADVLLVSEPSGEANLKREGVASERIHFVGNVMIDTLVRELPAAQRFDMAGRLGLRAQEFALVTLHRPSNVDVPGPLAEIVSFLERVSQALTVVFPMHPRTRKQLERFELMPRLRSAPGIRQLDALGYRETLGLMGMARLVITDSGGVQEETSYLRVPCLTLRPNTERPVTVTLGTNTVVGSDLALAGTLVNEIGAGGYKTGREIVGWDGQAATRIVGVLAEAWG